MRQGQQNRRGRGRNRKGQNPLTRSFESNGPDVKIRGTPAHIADKYITLARDASASGDPVLAENYLQHAEHYNRIILAFREQQISQGEANGSMGQHRMSPMGDPMDGADDYGDDDGGDDLGNEPQPVVPMMHRERESQPQPQHRFEGSRHEGGHRYDNRPQRHGGQPHRPMRDRFGGEPRGGGGYGAERLERQPALPVDPNLVDAAPMGPSQQHFTPMPHERPDRSDRPHRTERPERPERVERAERPDRPERNDRERADRGGEAPRRRERYVQQPHHEQPEFLRRPVRRPRRDAAPDSEVEPVTPADDDGRD